MTTTLEDKIKAKSVVTGVIGLGYVGLPLSYAICASGGQVIGFDVAQDKVERLNNGESYLDTLPASMVLSMCDQGLFKATSDFDCIADVDVIIICVPTPLNRNREPNLEYVINSAKETGKRLRAEQLVILESTTYPGTLKDEVVPLLERISGLKAGKAFFAAFSPEREDPGNPDFTTSTIPKIVGADSDHERMLATRFYSNFLQTVIPVASSDTAEAIKLTENIFRAVNIALVNELKVIYAKIGIDIWEVIEGAKTKPFGYMPFYPGPGLGGHCIPIDPFYLTWKAKEANIQTRFIELAGEINTQMPIQVCDEVVHLLKKKKSIAIEGANILIIGVAYKKNVNDQRESPAFPIIDHLTSLGANVSYFDPLVPTITTLRDYPNLAGKKSVVDLNNACQKNDICVLLTDHDIMPYKDIAENSDLIIDTRNSFSSRAIMNQHIYKA